MTKNVLKTAIILIVLAVGGTGCASKKSPKVDPTQAIERLNQRLDGLEGRRAQPMPQVEALPSCAHPQFLDDESMIAQYRFVGAQGRALVTIGNEIGDKKDVCQMWLSSGDNRPLWGPDITAHVTANKRWYVKAIAIVGVMNADRSRVVVSDNAPYFTYQAGRNGQPSRVFVACYCQEPDPEQENQ